MEEAISSQHFQYVSLYKGHLFSTHTPNRNAAREGIAIVEVGVSKTRYYVHKSILTRHSEYFERALRGPWI